GELGAGGENADQVERVGARQRHKFARSRLAPDLAQQADRLGKRELLAGKPRDKAAAADLAARFEPAIDAQQVAPRRKPSGFAIPSSTCGRSSLVPSTTSSKNEAPLSRMKPAIAWARGLAWAISGIGDSAAQSGAWRRASRVMGVVRTGPGELARPRSPASG